MENLPEYAALEDEGRRAAFSKFIKRQKVSVWRWFLQLELTSALSGAL